MLQEQRSRLKTKVNDIVLHALRTKSHSCLEAKPMATGTLQTNDGK